MPTQDGLESTVSFYNGAVEPQPLGEGAIKDLIISQPAQAIGRSSRSPCLPARTVRTQSYVSPHSTYTGYTAYLCPLPAHVPPSPQPQAPWGRWPSTPASWYRAAPTIDAPARRAPVDPSYTISCGAAPQPLITMPFFPCAGPPPSHQGAASHVPAGP
ncbi:hypothetical protein VFPFJ_02836 [Purpureocillium lilacinum]|uniref:Uncharacterized protein n=1 Tax=Purpureocillium lilacinum TaxID=33203 RepID=A0A179HUG0_PURLI|nr:hypothetical protein VFPFJ_02836 [Purpureocillium lilacinum]OAQ93674.1 hypothetical protein VFPFJ_02836 [Purpureocillium lilacinum]